MKQLWKAPKVKGRRKSGYNPKYPKFEKAARRKNWFS